MTKAVLLSACLLCWFSLHAQENLQLIWLIDGSFLRGYVIDSLPDAKREIRLTDGTHIQLPDDLILKVKPQKSNQKLLADGRVIKTQGAYSTFSVQMLSGKRSGSFENYSSTTIGIHLSVGYQLNPLLGIGMGLGIDGHEYEMLPIYLEARGFLVKKDQTRPSGKKHSFSKNKDRHLIRRFPLAYSFQLGYNLPINGFFSAENVGKVTGGVLVYPALGILMPSRGGTAFLLDVGYKFQRYTVHIENPWWTSTERVLLKNFTLRLGCYF